MHRNAVAVAEAAAALGLTIEVREFPEGTRTAEDAAAAIGVTVGQIVKSLVFAIGERSGDPDGEVVVALVSGSNQLDERRLATASGARKAWRIDADAVRAATGYPVGGIPPLGHTSTLRTFVDPDLLAFDEVWAAAGTPHLVFAVQPQRLVEVTHATVAELRKAPAGNAGGA